MEAQCISTNRNKFIEKGVWGPSGEGKQVKKYKLVITKYHRDVNDSQ